MFAVSLLQAVKQIETLARRLIELRSFTTEKTQPVLARVSPILADIAELLHSHRPFDFVAHTELTDRAVRQILAEQYDTGMASTDDFGPETVQTAKDTADVVVRKSWLFVPLGTTDVSRKNWRSVFDVIDTRLEGIIELFEKITRRLRASTVTNVSVAISENVVEMLTTLQGTIAQIVTTREYVSYRTDQNQDALLDAVEQQADAFSGDTDA